MATVRRGPRPADRFAQISNVLLQDFTLSSKARGLAAMLLSFPPGWSTTVETLGRQLTDGKAAIGTGLVELETKGYLIRKQQRMANGRLGPRDMWIFDDPRDAAAFRAQLDEPEPLAPSTENRFAGMTREDATSSQATPQTGFPSTGKPSTENRAHTKTDRRKTDRRKTGSKKRDGDRSSSSSPDVPREDERTTKPKTTPTKALSAAGLVERDHGRFKTWLREVRNARNANAVILAESEADELAESVREWRRSLDVAAEPDAEPVLCEHGNDIGLGVHMCQDGCDPARPRPSRADDAEPEQDGAHAPEWVREARAAGNWRALLVAADETTHGGVTPSILEGSGSRST